MTDAEEANALLAEEAEEDEEEFAEEGGLDLLSLVAVDRGSLAKDDGGPRSGPPALRVQSAPARQRPTSLKKFDGVSSEATSISNIKPPLQRPAGQKAGQPSTAKAAGGPPSMQSFEDWKREKGIPPGTKVFMLGGKTKPPPPPKGSKYVGDKGRGKSGKNPNFPPPAQKGAGPTTGTVNNRNSPGCVVLAKSASTPLTKSAGGGGAEDEDEESPPCQENSLSTALVNTFGGLFGATSTSQPEVTGVPAVVLRNCFRKLGFVENVDRSSPHFDYKFAFAKGAYNMSGRFADDLYRRHRPDQILA